MTIGERIRKAREDKNLTSSELAKIWGKTQASITEIEKDRSTKQYKKLGELCDILDVSADYILGRENKEKDPRAEQWEKLKQLCDILDIPINELTNITEKENSREHLTAAK